MCKQFFNSILRIFIWVPLILIFINYRKYDEKFPMFSEEI